MLPTFHLVTFDWHGIAVSVSVHQPSWLVHAGSAAGGPYLYLEIRAAVALPITETGYRSHFLSAAVLDEWGGALPYVQSWLEAEAESAPRQLSLL